MRYFLVVGSFAIVSACNSIEYDQGAFDYDATPTAYKYSDALDSGLKTLAPYPNADDVCRIVDETSVPNVLVKQGKSLIACPKHEFGALEDRIKEGAAVIAHAKHWSVLRVGQIGASQVTDTKLNK